MRGGMRAAQPLDAAVGVDEPQLLLGLEQHTVEEGHLVERAGDRALHAGAVVAPDVEDERVAQVAQVFDGIQQPAHVPVGVLAVSGEDLHLAGVELLLAIGQRVPGREQVGPAGQLGVRGDDPELLLPLEGLLPQGVPAAVEPAPVLVRPGLGHVVRRVGAAGGVVHEPRLDRVLGADAVQPLHRLVGQVVREVVLPAVLALLHAERRVVLGDDRVVLAGRAGQEAPPVVEAPPLRPVVERPGRALDVVRGEVPLAEPAGDVPVLTQDPGQRRAVARARRRVAGERAGVLGDGAETDPVVVAAGEHGGPGGRAHRRDMEPVVGEAHLLHPGEVRGGDRTAEGVRIAEPGVVDEDDEHVRRVLGGLRPGDHRPVRDRLAHRAAHRPAEGAVGNRQHGAVRAELARRLGQRGFQVRSPGSPWAPPTSPTRRPAPARRPAGPRRRRPRSPPRYPGWSLSPRSASRPV